VEELIDERQFGEPDDRHRVEPGRSVLEDDQFGRDQDDAVLLVAVHRRHHVGDRRDAFVVDALLEHVERAGVGQADRIVAQALFGDAEVDRHAVRKPRRIERDADVADAGARRHAGDICHCEQLRGGAVEARTAGPDPDPDRHGSGGDADEEIFDHVVVDHGAVAVDLEDQCLGTVLLGPVDRLVDLVDEDRVDVPADLQHVDPSNGISGPGIVLSLDAGSEQSEPGNQREHADR
jgi:hypothetical protein